MSAKSTVTKKQRFLKVLSSGEPGACVNVAAAARAVGVDRSTPYTWRKRDPEFAEAWDDAIEAGLDRLEAEADRRARDGSDTMLIFLLKTRGKRRGYVERQDYGIGAGTIDFDWETAIGISASGPVADTERPGTGKDSGGGQAVGENGAGRNG